MITCAECQRRLYPEDPRIPVGKYHHSTCDYFCNKPSYYRELEQAKSEVQPAYRPRPVDREIDQLKSGFLYLQNKVNELQATKKKAKFKGAL